MKAPSILGCVIPPVADSCEFSDFVKSVYAAADKNYLSASHVLHCDPMTVWRIVNNKQKDSPMLRQKWDIKQAKKPAPVCPDCGNVHIVPWCVEEHGEPKQVKPKPRPHPRPAVPYFKCRQDDIEQTMKQLEKYYPGEFERKE